MFTFNMNQPVFKDKKLRRALALAVNRPLMVESLWKNLASIPNGFNFPNYGETFDQNRRPMDYNIEEAKRLVKESGYDGYADHLSHDGQLLRQCRAGIDDDDRDVEADRRQRWCRRSSRRARLRRTRTAILGTGPTVSG